MENPNLTPEELEYMNARADELLKDRPKAVRELDEVLEALEKMTAKMRELRGVLETGTHEDILTKMMEASAVMVENGDLFG